MVFSIFPIAFIFCGLREVADTSSSAGSSPEESSVCGEGVEGEGELCRGGGEGKLCRDGDGGGVVWE